MSKLDEIAETPRQQAQQSTAALTEVVNEGETPNLDEMPRADALVIWQSFEQRAPDKEKILALAICLREIELPTVSSDAAGELLTKISAEIGNLATRIETAAAKL